MHHTLLSAAALCFGAVALTSAQAAQGVTQDEIVIGTIQDLSGPVAAYGKAARNGLQLRVDEINEQGGIHGRKIRLVVEDNAYDPKRAVLAAQKLVNQDKVFLIAAHIGTPMNNAAMPIQFDKGVINFFPLSAGREMYDPPSKLKFASVASYYDTIRMNVARLYKDKGAKNACVLYQDDDYGLEVVRGAEQGLKDIGVTLGERTTYKRGATDFSSQIARLKGSGCDFLVLGTIIRETIGAIGEARKIGWNPTIIGSQAAYTDLIHKLGGKGMDGFYAVSTVYFPYLDVDKPDLRFWANKYKTRFGDDPSTFSTGGYATMDTIVRVMQKAGPNLSADSFNKAIIGMGEMPSAAPRSGATPRPTGTWQQWHLGAHRRIQRLPLLDQLIPGKQLSLPPDRTSETTRLSSNRSHRRLWPSASEARTGYACTASTSCTMHPFTAGEHWASNRVSGSE